MATITTCDRCGVSGAWRCELGSFVLTAINDVNLPEEVDVCNDCYDKLIALIRAWWWEVQEEDAQASNAVPE